MTDFTYKDCVFYQEDIEVFEGCLHLDYRHHELDIMDRPNQKICPDCPYNLDRVKEALKHASK